MPAPDTLRDRALAEARKEVPCICDPAWTGLRRPDPNCDWHSSTEFAVERVLQDVVGPYVAALVARADAAEATLERVQALHGPASTIGSAGSAFRQRPPGGSCG